MAYEFSELVAMSKSWGSALVDNGWLSAEAAAALLDYDARTPENLFRTLQSRPLIVAFMGGTGVGKSSLLNRLAGKAIAKTGVERPTSKEVTLFHHQAVFINQLPDSIPLETVKVVHHENPANKNIIWVDMPDFDSTEAANRHLVLQWIPHIDVLVYVVSPERYRDSKAWQLLLAESGRHAWLFAINQWDRGQAEQYADFIRQLALAGFAKPLVYRTISSAEINDKAADEFAALQRTIASLATQHTIADLEQRGKQVRKVDLQNKIKSCITALGTEQDFTQLQQDWQSAWRKTSDILRQGFEWPMQRMALYFTEKQAHLMAGKQPAGPQTLLDQEMTFGLWDNWAQNRFDDALDELILQADQYQLPVQPLRQSLQTIRGQAAGIIHTQAELSARQALLNPGNLIQRWGLKITRFCEIFLPLAAMAWVAYQVLFGFYESSKNHTEYLGGDFAIHSILLILIVWLVPYFIQKQIKPSLEKAALNGIRQGLGKALATVDVAVEDAIEKTISQHTAMLAQGNKLIAQFSAQDEAEPIKEDTILSRILVEME